MKQLIIGSSGLIGSGIKWCTKDRGHDFEGTRLLDRGGSSKSLDITNRLSVLRLIRNMEPDVIFFCCGLSDLDKCEKKPLESYQTNIVGLKNVLDAANRVGSKIVFLSSAHIFDGRRGPYSENDTPNPKFTFGWHKLLSEHMVATTISDYLIIRSGSVFGWDRLNKNPVLQITNLIKYERKVSLVDDIIETPIYSRNLAEAIMDLVEAEETGTFNISGNESISPYKFGLNIAEIFGLDTSLIKPVKVNSLKTKGLKPVNTCLSNKKVKKSISTRLSSTQVGLKQMLKDEL